MGLAPATASAEPPDTRTAKQVYAAALADYKAQRYEPAATGFQHAYDLHPQPLLVFNIAQCRRKLGQFADALAMYRRYLDITTPAEAPETAREARAFVVEIEAYLAAHEPPPPKPVVATPEPSVQPTPAVVEKTPEPAATVLVDRPPAPKRPLRKNPWLWTGITVGVVAIGLGVGLGVGLTRGNNHVSSDLGTQSPSL